MRVMVFRIGNLGDTIIALPAFNAIRKRFQSDNIILLSSRNSRAFINSADVLSGTGLINEVIEYNPEEKGIKKIWEIFLLQKRIKKMKIDMLIYLPPSLRKSCQIKRDKKFFHSCGIKEILGMDNFSEVTLKNKNGTIKRQKKETEFLQSHLEQIGINTTDYFKDLFSHLVAEKEIQSVDTVMNRESKRPYVAFCTGGKYTSKKWPLDRYQELGKRLLDQYDVNPIVFGGASDIAEGNTLLSAWHRGFNACGVFNIREAAEGLRRCVLYIGNDTGTMHLASFAGTPCLAIFSSRSYPGMWEPYGQKHTVIKKQVPCECCELNVCNVPGHPCLRNTSVEEVFLAAKKYLSPLKQQKI